MSIITISSTNPKLSYILAKNPVTIRTHKKPFERELRKGKVYGWFSKADDSEFRLFFKDSEIETSFGNRQEFEYLDTSRYSHPYLTVMMITTALNTASGKDSEDDVGDFKTSVQFNLQCKLNLLNRMGGLTGNLEYSWLADGHAKVKVTANTVQEALNLATLICVVSSISIEDSYIPLNEAGITKYLKVLKRAKASYYLRHLFISRAITNWHLFEKLVPEINSEEFTFKYGNTQVQRLYAIRDALNVGSRGDNLIDLGCGEMYHTLKLLDKYTGAICVDADDDVFESNQAKLKKKQIENITLVKSEMDETWVKDNEGTLAGADVILSEVLEHREKKDASKLLRALLNSDANKVVVTVPCKDFNKFYGMGDDQMRHEDHKWEPTYNEWLDFLIASVPKGGMALTPGPLYCGDLVQVGGKSIGPTLITVFSKDIA